MAMRLGSRHKPWSPSVALHGSTDAARHLESADYFPKSPRSTQKRDRCFFSQNGIMMVVFQFVEGKTKDRV